MCVSSSEAGCGRTGTPKLSKRRDVSYDAKDIFVIKPPRNSIKLKGGGR